LAGPSRPAIEDVPAVLAPLSPRFTGIGHDRFGPGSAFVSGAVVAAPGLALAPTATPPVQGDQPTGRTWLRPADDREPRLPPVRSWSRLLAWSASQVLLLIALFQGYKIVRKTAIMRSESVAYGHAQDVLDFQGALNANIELDLQRWTLERGDLILLFNNIYAYYMYGFYACAIALLILAPERYRYLRRAFVISMVLALPWYALYPLAPPRFMEPFGWPFVDTLAVYGPNYFSESGLVGANRFAAMPSMHCGWTLMASLMIAAAIPHRWLGRTIATVLVAVMALTVMVTGNHYWLDIVAGWAVVGAALVINRWLPYPIRWTNPTRAGSFR
jgi:membrane-associated phospholipid phosphatase